MLLMHKLGSYSNQQIWTFRPLSNQLKDCSKQSWILEKRPTKRVPILAYKDEQAKAINIEAQRDHHHEREVPRLVIHSATDFERLVSKEKPAVIERLNLGRCTDTWTTFELMEKIGPDRIVLTNEFMIGRAC